MLILTLVLCLVCLVWFGVPKGLEFAVADVEYTAGMQPRKDETGTHSHQDNFKLSDEMVSPDDYDLSLVRDGWGFDLDPEDDVYDDEEFEDYG